MPLSPYASITEAAAEIAEGRASPVGLMDMYLDRIARYDGKLGAFVEVYADEARLAAEGADKAIRSGHRIGPLHGLPIAVKDLVEIEGRITTGGSYAWRDRRSTVTATVVRRLIAAGMIVIGKTHTVEFAYGGWGTNQHMGTPWNPWDLQVHRVPGGSSSGTGVAVAAGLAAAGIGSDTGGSVRIPAAFCGTVGLKTTVGRISTYGVLALSETLDTVGHLTRSVEDAALLLNALQGPDPNDPNTLRRVNDEPSATLRQGVFGLRLGALPDQERAAIHPEVLQAYDEALRQFADLGAHLVKVALPRRFADYREMTGMIIATEGYAYLAEVIDREDLPLDENVRRRMLTGRSVAARDYVRALRERLRAKREFLAAIDGIDALVLPTTPAPAIPAAEVDESTTPAEITRFGNLMEMCGLALRNGLSAGGLPISMQILGRGYDEATVLRIGWAYEQATEWHKAHPPGLD